jgi:hypothetical protein
MEEIKFTSIKEMLHDWLGSKPERNICLGGWFKAEHMLTWHNILNGTPGGNYVIFFNAGGMPFEIWRDKEGKFIEHLLEKDKWQIFAYHLNGKDYILKNLPNN